MKKTSLLLLLVPFLLTGCSKKESKEDFKGQTLTIYNCEDYISSGDEEYRDLIAEFEELYNCKVNYYTYDTNETMYNQFKLQKEGTYDLICTSDYMIQKMIKEDLLEPIDNISENVPNYDQYCSPTLRNKLKQMKVTLKDGTVTDLNEYAVGYMWGTLGLIYDPTTSLTMEEDIKSWDILWNDDYPNIASIKNSMRDTYVVGLMHHFGKTEEYNLLRQAYLDNPSEENAEAYNAYIQDVFNLKLDDSEESKKENTEKIEIVKEELINLKKNIFGLETDSGKTDIIEGSKIKINLAWSGDAVYSMWTALEEADKILKYQVPEDGANIWYDGWFLPKGGNADLAYKFLDYISSPDAAAANMDYIGYTSFITGKEVYKYVGSLYGAGLYIDDQEYAKEELVVYDNKLYACIKDSVAGILPTNEEYFECLELDNITDPIDLEYQDMVSYDGKIYGCYEDSATSFDQLKELEPYNLTHIFDKVTGYDEEVVYAYPDYENILESQYPSDDIIVRCAIMNDFGEYNDQVIIAWGQVKAYTQMTPYYIFLGVVASLVVAYFVINAAIKKKSNKYKRAMVNKEK